MLGRMRRNRSEGDSEGVVDLLREDVSESPNSIPLVSFFKKISNTKSKISCLFTVNKNQKNISKIYFSAILFSQRTLLIYILKQNNNLIYD